MQVQVLTQGIEYDANLGASCFVREVLLCVQERAMMLAKTLIPQPDFHRGFRALSVLGNHPLGDWLFRQSHLIYKPIILKYQPTRRVLQEIDLPHFSQSDARQLPAYLWCREKRFKLRENRLFLFEIFLTRLS